MQALQQLLIDAVAHLHADRLELAEETFRRALAIDANQPDALHLLGLVRWRQGANHDAESLMLRSIAVSPTNPGYYVNLGRLYVLDLNNVDACVDYFEQATLLEPQNIAWRQNLCIQIANLATRAVESENLEKTAIQCRRGFDHIMAAPAMTTQLYELLARMAQLALAAGDRDLAVTCVKARNRYDFADMKESDIEVFPVDFLDFQAWCDANGYKSVSWREAAQPFPPAALENYPDYLHEEISVLQKDARRRIGVALDVEMDVVQGIYVAEFYNTFILGGRSTMLHDPSAGAFVHHPSKGPLVGVGPNQNEAIFRLARPDFREIVFDQPTIFVPSNTNYAHFLIDHVPQIMACEHVAEARGLPVALFDVKPYQYELLDYLGIKRSRVIDVKSVLAPVADKVLYRFQRAVVPSVIPYAVAYRWVREACLARLPRRGKKIKPLPKRVFLSRRAAYPKHRIVNDTEVGEYLAKRGFEVVLPEKLSIVDTVALFAEAEIVVSPLGAGTLNYVFMPPEATFILLNNPEFFHPEASWNDFIRHELILVGTFRQLTCPFVDDPASVPPSPLYRLELPVLVDLEALGQLVDEAEVNLVNKR